MIGQRIFPHKFGQLLLPEGGFGKNLRGRWKARPPGEDERALEQRDVDEHPDGTITCRSVINGGARCWRLERGIWEEVNKGGRP